MFEATEVAGLICADAGSTIAPVRDGDKILGYVELASAMPLDAAEQVAKIEGYNREWIQLRDGLKSAKFLYTTLMILITLFVLFVAVWIAFFMAKQISVPISALLDAANGAGLAELLEQALE